MFLFSIPVCVNLLNHTFPRHDEWEKDLSLIHLHEEQDKRVILNPLLNPESRKAFHECYENFLTSICIPEIHSRAVAENIFNNSSSTRNSGPEEICYRYQAFPCLRVIKPSEFSIEPRCDMAYGHSIGPHVISYWRRGWRAALRERRSKRSRYS